MYATQYNAMQYNAIQNNTIQYYITLKLVLVKENSDHYHNQLYSILL